MSVIFKIAYDTDIRRVSVASSTSFNEFNELVRKLFIDSIPDNYVVKYVDDEGDLVSITCDREFAEAFAFAAGKPLLRLTIVALKPKVESKPAPVPTPAKEEPRRAVPPTPLNFNADPIVGIIEQALDCPELQGLINHFGVSIENVKNIVNGLKQDVAEALEKGKEKVKEGEKGESSSLEQDVHQAYCDHCDKQIVGIRYKCSVCCDFDLCSSCEALLPSASVHDTQHLFLKVFKPASLPSRRPLLRNFYAEPAGSCPYGRRGGAGGPGCRGPWAGRRWGGPGCHQWRQNLGNTTPSQPPTEGTPVTETCSRWQPRGQNWMSSRFIADVTINDGSQMEPGVPFHKVWRLKNTGTVAWPEGTSLSFVAGDVLGGQDNVILGRVVQPDEEIDVGVDMVAPSKPGRYISNFRLVNPGGISFGHRVWADILVVPSAVPVEGKKEFEQPPQPCTIVIEKKVEEPVAVEEKKEEPTPVTEEKKEELPKKKEEEEDKGYIYAEQLAALVAMGFVDRQANKVALAKRKGNVIAAVNDLLN